MVYKKDFGNSSTSIGTNGSKLLSVRVLDIILDIEHPQAIKYGVHDAIGTIAYTYLDDNLPLERAWKNNNVALPLLSNIKNYPLRNEIVLIVSTHDKNTYKRSSRSDYYIPSTNIWNHPHHNALPTIQDSKNPNVLDDYQNAENGQTSRQVTDGSTDINLGNYFSEKLQIKPLLPYEGDMILEGRFGNSIRLGSTVKAESLMGDKLLPEANKNKWSDAGFIGDPIMIIKNGQRTQEINDKGWEHTVEDLNLDDSSIYLTSNQRMTGFIPASDNEDSYSAGKPLF
tara:strand:- start:4828 stop:5679 length:852 start_codon:yes stop_codon:yes gene_type:complete